MIKKLNESHVVKKSTFVAFEPRRVRISPNIRGIFNINKREFNNIFIKHIESLIAKKKNVVIVVSKPQLVTLAKILKDKKLFSLIDEKKLTIVAHRLESKTGFYFQKDFHALLITKRTDLEVDLLSSQIHYKGINI